MNKAKSKAFDAISLKEAIPHLALRKAASPAGAYILHVNGDAHLQDGDHVLLKDVYDALCAAYTANPQSFKSALWGKLFKDAADAEASANPSDTVDKIRSASPSDIAGDVERTTVPFPAIATKSTQS